MRWLTRVPSAGCLSLCLTMPAAASGGEGASVLSTAPIVAGADRAVGLYGWLDFRVEDEMGGERCLYIAPGTIGCHSGDRR